VTSSVLPVLGWLAAAPLGYPPYPEKTKQSQISLELLQLPQFKIQTFSALSPN